MILDSARASIASYRPPLSSFRSYDNYNSFTNVSSLIDESPEAFDGSTVFNQFHELWRANIRMPLDIPARFSELCQQSTEVIPKLATHTLYRDGLPDIQNIIEMMNLERDTWSLVSALYTDRFHAELEAGTASLLNELPAVKHSEREIVRVLYEHDNGLREIQIFIDWLERRVREHIEKVAERFECLFNQTAVWENTFHALSHLPDCELKSRNLPLCLHPDVFCSTGAQLDAKDEADNERYLNYLFLCVRGGDLSRAQRLCLQRGEVWRAVSFEGWRPFHYNGFAPSSAQDEGIADMNCASKADMNAPMLDEQNRALKMEPDVDRAVDPVVGNTNRVLFKSVCWWNAENSNLQPYERAIYAALSGNLSVLTQILPASWTDLTWAHFRALVEARVDSNLRDLLHTGPRADTLAVTGKTKSPWSIDGGLPLPDTSWQLKDWSPADAFTKVEAILGWSPLGYLRSASTTVSLDAVKRSVVNDFLLGNGSQIPPSVPVNEKGMGSEPSLSAILYCLFHATQQVALLRNYDDYLYTVADLMPRLVRVALGSCEVDDCGQLQPPSLSWITGTKNLFVCHMLRFLAHFVLFIRTMEPGIPDPPCAQILKGYLSVLMADHRTDLIANYAAMLHDSNARIDWYSSFLVGIVEPLDRERCLSLAMSAGFDVQRLTRSVVRLLREQQLLLPSQQPNSIAPDPGVTGSEFTHANAIERVRLASLLQEDNPNSLSEQDRRRIASLDWLFYDPRQRGEALIAANSLLRTFIAMNCLKAAEQIINRLPDGTLARAKIICEDSGSPEWLVNTIREHECLVLYLESQEAFADWLKQSQSNKPIPPSELSSQLTSSSYGNRAALTERLRVEEVKKQYEARVQRWRHLLRLDTEVAAEKLLALLNYPSPGWLVDVTCCSYNAPNMLDRTASCDPALDGTVATTTIPSPSPMLLNPELSGLGDSPSSRLLQMQVLRETCLSSAVSLLIRLYQTAGMHKECVELSNLIASKQQGLYKLFSRIQIRQLFDRFKESFEHLVGLVGEPLGYGSGVADMSVTRGTISDSEDFGSLLRTS